jgi:hypothetical protein
MDVMTTYLYESLDSDIYIKVLDKISVLNTNANRNLYYVKLVKSLYDLKQLEKNVVQPTEGISPKQRILK